jgi:hypothetical protein
MNAGLASVEARARTQPSFTRARAREVSSAEAPSPASAFSHLLALHGLVVADRNAAPLPLPALPSVRSPATKIQRKCACGGTCENCREEDEPLPLQRKPDGSAPTEQPVSPTETVPGFVLVENGSPTGRGQSEKAAFMAALRAQLFSACDEELAQAGRTARDCPYLEGWLSHYESRSASHIERAIRLYTGTRARTSSELAEAVVQRVRAAARYWVETGEITGVPSEVSLAGGFSSAGIQGLQILDRLVGSSTEPAESRPRAKSENGAHAESGSQLKGIQRQLGRGTSLPGSVRSRMESAFGQNFAHVQLHTDARASQLSRNMGARAFTIGSNIAFASNEYRPGTLAGDALIAHELAHVVQQRGASSQSFPSGVQDRALEEDADNSAIHAALKLWGGLTSAIASIGSRILPSLRAGLRLQRCQEVRMRCPRGYSWRVQSTSGLGSFGCLCHWKCMPGEPPRPPSSRSEYRCPPGMNCTTGVRYEDLSSDYTKTGYGAAMTPLGAQAYCGCFPLNLNGVQVSDSPLRPTDFELTDVMQPLADVSAARRGGAPRQDPRTGTILPEGRRSTEGPPPQRGGAAQAPPPRQPQRVLIVGAEQAAEFNYAREVRGHGDQVVVVNPRSTPLAEQYRAEGGNYVQGRIEDLHRGQTFHYIREDFPYPLGRSLQPNAAFAEARISRLEARGRWVVVTEQAEFASTLQAVGSMQGVSVTRTEVPIHHEATPQSPYAQESRRIILIFEKQ